MTCTACPRTDLTTDDYYASKKSKTGREKMCKPCRRKQVIERAGRFARNESYMPTDLGFLSVLIGSSDPLKCYVK